jgi:uncharacterized membrane protein
MVLVIAFLIGVVSGLRSLTAPAAVCWAAHLGWFHLENSRLAFLGSTGVTYLFSALAVGELIADKLPFTPARTQFLGLSARSTLGALSGSAICVAAGQPWIVGAILGAAGGITGAFAGYKMRTGLARKLSVPDFVVALLEDVLAIGSGLLLVTRL